MFDIREPDVVNTTLWLSLSDQRTKAYLRIFNWIILMIRFWYCYIQWCCSCYETTFSELNRILGPSFLVFNQIKSALIQLWIHPVSKFLVSKIFRHNRHFLFIIPDTRELLTVYCWQFYADSIMRSIIVALMIWLNPIRVSTTLKNSPLFSSSWILKIL